MHDEAARRLIAARQRRSLECAAGAVPADADAAYATQHHVAQALGWFGAQMPRYWKSGGPSRAAVQTHAALPPHGVWASPASAGAWHFTQRGIEAEIALRLSQDVDPARASRLDRAQATALVDAMCVSIEIVDSRWREGLDAPALAKLADQQAHGALVLGDWVPFALRDWASQVCTVRIGAHAPVVRRGSHAMADPVFVLPAWLRHATRAGATVPAGTVVTTGTWVGILAASAGDRVSAEFPGIGHASVQF